MNGLIPLERIIQQTTKTMPKTITAANKQKNCKLDRAATFLLISNLKNEIKNLCSSALKIGSRCLAMIVVIQLWSYSLIPFKKSFNNRKKKEDVQIDQSFEIPFSCFQDRFGITCSQFSQSPVEKDEKLGVLCKTARNEEGIVGR